MAPPDSPADGATSFDFHLKLAKEAERGLFDVYFLADSLAIAFGGGIGGGNAKVAGFEPVTLFSALAPLTKNLGFIATASTTCEEPYNLARKFASLDLISDGRAGWNVVTTATESAAHNFNLDHSTPMPSATSAQQSMSRWSRSCGTVSRTMRFCATRRAGSSLTQQRSITRPTRRAHFKVKGPLNVSRSPQGHPVIVQAGQSDDGRGLAAATAEVIFTAHQKLDTAQEFYRDIKARARGLGRNPDHILIMPGVSPFVGRTEAEAREKYDRLTSLILEEDGIALIKGLTGRDARPDRVDLDGALAAGGADRGHEVAPGADPPDR